MSWSTDPVTLRTQASEFVRASIAPQAGPERRGGPAPARPAGDRSRRRVCFGLAVPRAHGGREADPLTYGWIHAEIGAACASTRAILTVHDMVATAIGRWGDDAQRARWLPRLASRRALGAFALTEPETGSDAAGGAHDGGTRRARPSCSVGTSAGSPRARSPVSSSSSRAARRSRPPSWSSATRPGCASPRCRRRWDCARRCWPSSSWMTCACPPSQRLGPIGAGISHIASTAPRSGPLRCRLGMRRHAAGRAGRGGPSCAGAGAVRMSRCASIS